MSNQLLPGQSLAPNEKLVSENGAYVFILQVDGNLVLYTGAKALWASGTNGKAVKECIMQTDGNLVLYGYDNNAVWASGTNGKPGSHLIVQNDGNVVIYFPEAIWATNTDQQ